MSAKGLIRAKNRSEQYPEANRDYGKLNKNDFMPGIGGANRVALPKSFSKSDRLLVVPSNLLLPRLSCRYTVLPVG